MAMPTLKAPLHTAEPGMNPYLLLLLEMLISIGASIVVLRILTTPLLRTLERICPDEESASFWLSYTKVILVMAPLILVLVMDSFSRFGNPLDTLRTTLLATLAGLLVGMHLLGRRLGGFIRPPTELGSGK